MIRFEIQAKGNARAELRLYGNIGDDWNAEESNDAKTVVERIGNLTGAIDVRINSFGGAVADGLAIFNALRRHDGEVTTHIDGVAYSIASLIAMAGQNINMASNALMMIHAPWGMTIGNAPEMRETADILDKHADAMIGSYLREGGPDAETVRGWLTDGEDHYFSAIDAVELGLVDAVSDPVELTDIAASLRDTCFNTPAINDRTTQEDSTMAEPENTGGAQSSPKDDVLTTHSKTVQAAQQAGAKAEAKRRSTIEAVFDGFYDGDPLDPVTAIRAECLDDVKCSELDARRVLQDYLAQKSSAPIVARETYAQPDRQVPPPGASRHLGGAVSAIDQDEKTYKAFSDAVEFRMGLSKEPEKGNPYSGLSLSEMARHFARAVGFTNVEMASSYDIVAAVMDPSLRLNIGRGDIRMQHATGDFPGILANVIDKAIRVRYETATETWRSVARVGSVNDFRQAQRPAMSAFSDLKKVPEGGEYKHGSMSDVVEYLQADKFGRMFSITREALLADDLQAFNDTAMAMADAANAIVGDMVWAVYTSNPTLNQDGTAVFDPAHANQGTAGAPSVTTLSEARKLMRVQKDPSGTRTLNLGPALLILPPIYETEGLSLITAQNLDYEIQSTDEGLAQRNAANQFGTLTPVVENRLGGTTGNDTKWFVQANPQTPVPFIEVAFVRGQETPTIATREGWNVDGIEYKVRQEFGVAPLAYQPVVENAG